MYCARTPAGFNIARKCNPFGVGVVVSRVVPGCAARPRAVVLDCFAVNDAPIFIFAPEAKPVLVGPGATATVSMTHARTSTHGREDFGVDAGVNLTKSIGIQGERFTGAGLGEHNGGIG
jgi:hypothetical protein